MKKWSLVVLSAVVLLTVASLTVKKIQDNAVNATSGQVSLSYNTEIYFGTVDDNGDGAGGMTRNFAINGSLNAYCGNPRLGAPNPGSYTAEGSTGLNADDNNIIRLMAYIANSALGQYGNGSIKTNARQKMKELFGNKIDDDDIVDTVYGWAHAFIGYVYSGSDYNGVTTSSKYDSSTVTSLENIKVSLGNMISSGNAYWLVAKNYQLYKIEGGEGYQDLLWIEETPRKDIKFTKINTTTNEPMANAVFEIKSKTTDETHIVVADENGVVDTSAVSHTSRTNYYDNLYDENNPYQPLNYSNDIGIWFFGVPPNTDSGVYPNPNNSKGALLLGKYTITELECDANKFCHQASGSKMEINITESSSSDLGEWENNCTDFSLETTAVDNADGDKILAVDQDVEVKDTVAYCLKADTQFTIKGVIMNKSTKQPLLVNGEKVEQTIQIMPTIDTTTEDEYGRRCGTVDMIYSFNTKDLGGAELVVFEDLYHEDELLLSYADFDNESQSISVAPDPPETGFITTESNQGSNNIGNIINVLIPITIITSVGGYVTFRVSSKKKFYRH